MDFNDRYDIEGARDQILFTLERAGEAGTPKEYVKASIKRVNDIRAEVWRLWSVIMEQKKRIAYLEKTLEDYRIPVEIT